MDKEFINKLVIQVVSRIARQLGADGSRQTVLTVCTGCGGDVNGAAEGIKQLVMKGYRTPLFFSNTAGNSYRPALEAQLGGLPYSQTVNTGQWSQWTGDLEKADALLVPLLSMNTLSRLALLMADAPHTHLLLNGMTLGKPLLMVCDNALLASVTAKHLKQAMQERLKSVEQYGAVLCNRAQVVPTLEDIFGTNVLQSEVSTLVADAPEAVVVPQPLVGNGTAQQKPTRVHSGRVLTGVEVNLAAQAGCDLVCGQGVIITPMAKDLLMQKRVNVLTR